MKKLILISIMALGLSACYTNGETNGAVVGAVAGGILGNAVGKTAGAIAGAAVGGMVGSSVGKHMDQHETQTRVKTEQLPPPPPGASYECKDIENAGVRASCEQGVADRNKAAQQEAEKRAYKCARHGWCQ